MNFIIICLAVLCITSCSLPQKTMLKGDVVYVYDAGSGPMPVQTYTPYTVTKIKKVAIVDNATYLIIQDNPVIDVGAGGHYRAGTPVPYPGVGPSAWKQASVGNAYFNENAAGARQVFWYRDGKMVLQTASIPVKIRSKYKDPANIDNYSSQVETGFNIGFLTGYKFNWNKFRSTNNILGVPIDKYSITIGGLFSIGGTDLNTNTTRPKIAVGRKTAMVSYGTAIVFGFQSLNVGYAIGWDQGVGPSAESWIYKGKLWNGVILSLDLIK